MFSNLNIDDLEAFREDIIDKIVTFLKGKKDEEYYAFVSTLKGRIFNDESLVDILQECKDLLKKPQAAAFQKFIDDLIAIEANDTYKSLLKEDAEAHPPKKPTVEAKPKVSQLGKFAEKKSEEKEVKSLHKLLKHQIDSVHDLGVSQKELTQVFLAESKSPNYNGFFLDIDEIFASIDKTKFNHLKGMEETNAIQNELKKKIGFEIDRLIDESERAGLKRIQIVFKNGLHYTPCDIDITQHSCCVYDAAGEFRKPTILEGMTKHSTKLKKVIDVNSPGFTYANKKINNGNLQKENFGCGIYAIYLLREFAKFTHEVLFKLSEYDVKRNLHNLSWFALTPEIVCMAQSTTIIDYYLSLKPQYRDRMDELTENNTKNAGYTLVLAQLKDELKTICQNKSEEELTKITQKSVLPTLSIHF